MDRSFLNGLDLGPRPIIAFCVIVLMIGLLFGAGLTALIFWLTK